MKSSTCEDSGLVLARIRKPFERIRVQTIVEGESMTVRSHLDECNINKLVERFHRTGVLPPATEEPQYGDVSDLQGKTLTELANKSQADIKAYNAALSDAEKQRDTQSKKDAEELKTLRDEKNSTAARGDENPEKSDT